MKRSQKQNQKKRQDKQKSLNHYNTVDVGETCRLASCCREVCLGATPCHVGKRLFGFNTISDQYEEWEVVTVFEPDHWRSIVRRTM